jgi:hypothetical protein
MIGFGTYKVEDFTLDDLYAGDMFQDNETLYFLAFAPGEEHVAVRDDGRRFTNDELESLFAKSGNLPRLVRWGEWGNVDAFG